MSNRYECNMCKFEQACVFETLRMSKPDICPYYNDYKTNWKQLEVDDLKSKWVPEVGNGYYMPGRLYGRWSVIEQCYRPEQPEKNCIEAGEAFKTKADCKRYMNAKGWINEEPWKI